MKELPPDRRLFGTGVLKMGIMNLCICDDEQITADYYSRELYRLFGERRIQAEIHTFSDPAKLMNELGKGNKWDVYFLDIDMGRTNGIELARSIRKTDGSARIIFLSIHEELVLILFR
jgi:DNA-binding LytR/AlgR family response regulator